MGPHGCSVLKVFFVINAYVYLICSWHAVLSGLMFLNILVKILTWEVVVLMTYTPKSSFGRDSSPSVCSTTVVATVVVSGIWLLLEFQMCTRSNEEQRSSKWKCQESACLQCL